MYRVSPSIALRSCSLVLVLVLAFVGVFASSTANAADLPFRSFVPLAITAPQAPATQLPSLRLKLNSQGDFVGQGRQYSYTEQDASFSAVMVGSGYLSMSVNAANGDWWSVVLAAPYEQTLKVGVYEGAVRAISRTPEKAGLDVGGNGRGCNIVEGRFTISELKVTLYDHVERLKATFEQRCPENGNTAPLLGEIEFTNPTPPPLQITLDIDERGGVDPVTGAATVQGNVTCNRQVDVSSYVRVTQGEKQEGMGIGSRRCSSTPTPWRATLQSSITAFGAGTSEVFLNGFVYDTNYRTDVFTSTTAQVQLEVEP